jgi:hypothetical protein
VRKVDKNDSMSTIALVHVQYFVFLWISLFQVGVCQKQNEDAAPAGTTWTNPQRQVQGTNIISPSKDNFFQGEDITFLLKSTVGAIFFQNDYIRILNHNVSSDYYNAPYVFHQSLGQLGVIDGSTEATVSVKVRWDIGSYKAVLFLEGGINVLGISSAFEVKQNTVTVHVAKTAISQGEEVTFMFESDVAIPIGYGDYFMMVPSNVTGDFTQWPVMHYWWSEPYEINVTKRATWEVGSYKVMFFLAETNIVLGVSPVFEVKQNIVTVLASKTTLYQGEDVAFMFESDFGIPIGFGDYFRIVPSNATGDFSQWPVMHYWSSVPNDPNVTKRATWEVGSYNVMFFLAETNIVLGKSPVVLVLRNVVLIELRRSVNIIGTMADFVISSVPRIVFNPFADLLVIVSEDETNLGSGQWYAYGFLGFSNSSGTTTLQANWGIGRYKAVVFLDRIVVGVSNVFRIFHESGTDAPSTRSTTHPTYRPTAPPIKKCAGKNKKCKRSIDCCNKRKCNQWKQCVRVGLFGQ